MHNLQEVFERINLINSEDERRLVDPETGTSLPQELLYSKRMTHWLNVLAPNASDELRVAVFAQHIARFKHPRKTYPEGRTGYLKWKAALLQIHAETTAAILEEMKFPTEFIDRVSKLLRKQGLGRDPETQILEDCACLVFIEMFYMDFAPTQDREKMIDIVQKTLRRMSESAKEHAMKLPAAVHVAKLLESSSASQEK
jgi:hypothetical protein